MHRFQNGTDTLRLLAAGALLAFLASFGQTYFIAVFAGAIREAFSLSHGQWGVIYSAGTLASALVMIWAGGLADRFRVRRLGAAVLGALALACLLMALAPTAGGLLLAVFALRLSGQGMTHHLALVAMGRWFEASRGKALAVAMLGSNAGEAVLPVGFAVLLLQHDWQRLWLLAAGLAVLGAAALVGLLRREAAMARPPASPASRGIGQRHWTRGQALRHPLFWWMVPALLGPAALNTTFFFQQVHFAAGRGWAHVELVALFPLYVGLMIAAMLLSGWLVDRTGAIRLMPWIQVPGVAAFGLFAGTGSLPLTGLGLAFLALTTGAVAIVPSAFWAELYGTRHLGAIKAMAAAVMVFGTALGPGLSGVLIDLGVALERQYQAGALYLMLTTVLMRVGIARASRGPGGAPSAEP